ncbi:MAG: hypothetical protein P8Z42_14630 [Anaerolineales bacterium]|jgi:hypothetical protein
MEDGFGIVCGAIVLVLLFNLGILVSILRRGGKIFDNPFKGYRPPWDLEQETAEELRKSLLELDRLPDKETTSPDG